MAVTGFTTLLMSLESTDNNRLTSNSIRPRLVLRFNQNEQARPQLALLINACHATGVMYMIDVERLWHERYDFITTPTLFDAGAMPFRFGS